MAKKKKNKAKKNKSNVKKLSLKQWFLLLGIIVALIVFLPTTIILAIGMLPTLVAFIVDRYPGKNKTFTIGALNFTGCFPYLLEIWLRGNSMTYAVQTISDPKSIIVMYAAAALGYGINMAVTFVVSLILIQRSEIRIKKIEKEKQALEDRWGRKVNRLFIQQSETAD